MKNNETNNNKLDISTDFSQLARDVVTITTLLRDREWSGSCAKTELGQRLELEISRLADIAILHNRLSQFNESTDPQITQYERNMDYTCANDLFAHGVIGDGENCAYADDDEAHYFTVYRRNEDGTADALMDFSNRTNAESAISLVRVLRHQQSVEHPEITTMALRELRQTAWAEGINYAAGRLAAAFNQGCVNKPVAEVGDVVRMILTAKDDLANDPGPAADGLSGEYAEKALEDLEQQLRLRAGEAL